MKKYLIYGFALLGFATFIFLACSVAEPEPVEPPQDTQVDVTLQNNYGKYQVATFENDFLVVLNTETGVMKSYNPTLDGWVENSNLPSITFTH